MGISRPIVATIVLAVFAAACATNGATDDAGSVPTATAPIEAIDPAGPVGTTGTDAGLGSVIDDAAWPEGSPDFPTGAMGFSRYVYAEIGDSVEPFLLEGPAVDQVRCQEVELPCSYLDLKELADSDAPVPDALAMSRSELETLVSQLDELSAVLVSLDTIDAACAAGYEPYTTQWPNMGVHLRHPVHTQDRVLDPSRPDVVMFARPGGENTPLSGHGTCEEGVWTGDPTGYEVVGSAFYLPLTGDHPEGFAGPIDNWHIHFNSCGGSQSLGAAPVSPAACEADGGMFFEVDPQWMIHAYVVPDFDNQAGVFSMWNPAVSPVSDPADVHRDRSQLELEGAVTWSIDNFSFTNLNADVGQPVVFGNSDAAPHTVTSDDGLFDSGNFGTGGSFEISFDEPGEYPFYCALHPSMTGTVSVG